MLKKIKHILAAVLGLVGFSLIFGATGTADFSGVTVQLFKEAFAGLLMVGTAVVMSADVEVEAPDDEEWEQEKSRR